MVAALLGGCSGQPLAPWHQARLHEEFRADRADEIGDFPAYLALEDRLFRQLDAEVYAKVPTGPEFGLVRYSRGSAADPHTRPVDWNRSFELPASRPVGGVLLLHGMSDSPYSLRSIGALLNEHGYWVIGLRLPGHGTAPAGLLHVRWQDMAAAVRLAAIHLAERTGGAPLHLIGYSNGAPLAVNYTLDAQEDAALPEPASLVLLSPAIGLARGASLAAWKRALSNLPGLGGYAWLDIQPEFDPFRYNSFTTNAGAQVFALTRHVSRRIVARQRASTGPVLPPVLVIKSTVDATVSTQAVADRLLARLRPAIHELLLYDINRVSRITSVLIDDPGPLTARVMNDDTLPFTVSLVTNRSPESAEVVVRRKAPFSGAIAGEQSLGLSWPQDILSLSHIALPFPPDDPLYGREPPADGTLFLGHRAIQGERGVLRIPANYFLRLRHNPFHAYQQQRILEWLAAAGDGAA